MNFLNLFKCCFFSSGEIILSSCTSVGFCSLSDLFACAEVVNTFLLYKSVPDGLASPNVFALSLINLFELKLIQLDGTVVCSRQWTQV